MAITATYVVAQNRQTVCNWKYRRPRRGTGRPPVRLWTAERCSLEIASRAADVARAPMRSSAAAPAKNSTPRERNRHSPERSVTAQVRLGAVHRRIDVAKTGVARIGEQSIVHVGRHAREAASPMRAEGEQQFLAQGSHRDSCSRGEGGGSSGINRALWCATAPQSAISSHAHTL